MVAALRTGGPTAGTIGEPDVGAVLDVDRGFRGEAADHLDAPAAEAAVGGWGPPGAVVVDRDVEAAVRARGDPVADASVVVGAVRVFDGVGDGLPQRELEVVDELGGVRGARPPLHGEPDLAQLVGPSGDLAAERGGQQLHEQRGDVVARSGLGRARRRSPAVSIGATGGLPQRCAASARRRMPSSMSSPRRSIEPVGVETSTPWPGWSATVRLGHRRRPSRSPEHRTVDAVAVEAAVPVGVDEQRRWVPGAAPRSARPVVRCRATAQRAPSGARARERGAANRSSSWPAPAADGPQRRRS